MLREQFRHLREWESLSEFEGIAPGATDLTDAAGNEWALEDIKELYDVSQHCLTSRQSDAIRLHLYENVSESDAAVAMGTAATNSVAGYATAGLKRIVEVYNGGGLPALRRFCQAQGRRRRAGSGK